MGAESMRPFRMGEWTVAPDRNEIERRDGPVRRVEPRVMEVLAVLAQRPGDVVTRDELIRAVWGETFVGDEVLTNAIRELRKALEDDARSPRYIQTLPKKGYRLVANVETAPRRRWGLTTVPAAAALVVVALAVILWLRADEPPTPSGPPSLAVLDLDNLSGDASFDWLRAAISRLIVTDLSQSQTIVVLSPERLHQILDAHEGPISCDVVQELRAEVGTVLVGDFVQADDEFRISVRLQDASTCTTLRTETITGAGESNLFAMVDELGRRIHGHFSVEPGPDVHNVADVTTSSLEAWRYYVDGMALASRARPEEAIQLLERAVAIDPQFATALVNLADEHWKLGNQAEYELFVGRALEHADRLKAPERLYIEGTFYGLTEETMARSIAAFREAVERYPASNENVRNAVNGLGWTYLLLERYEDAVDVLEPHVPAFVGNAGIVVQAYAALGELDRAKNLLENVVRQDPEHPWVHQARGFVRTMSGELDEALDAYRKAESLRPTSGSTQAGRWQVFVLLEDWEKADELALRLADSSSRRQRTGASRGLAWSRLHRGASRSALETFLRTGDANAEPPHSRAFALDYAAHILLERGEPSRALELANVARVEGKGTPGEWEGLHYAALAYAALEQWDAAFETAEMLRQKADSLPTEKEKRRYHHLAGQLALARGRDAEAVRELERAAAMLPPRGVTIGSTWVTLPQHVPIWYSLGSAYLASGDDVKASECFLRIADSGYEHLHWPIPYVRSFYFLGRIHEERGETEKSKAYYRRFHELWHDGDLDRERVAEAARKSSP